MSNWITIKIREDTYKELIKLCGILQIKFEKRVGFDEAINELLTFVPSMEVRVIEIDDKNQ